MNLLNHLICEPLLLRFVQACIILVDPDSGMLFQIIFGADKQGFVHMWDLSGGKTSVAFLSNNEVNDHTPMFWSYYLMLWLELIFCIHSAILSPIGNDQISLTA